MLDTCLVTGGAGFIGCAVAGGLVGRFRNVVVLDSLHPQIHPSRQRPDALHSGVALVEGDVTDAAAWDALLAKLRPEVIVHLAAETGTGQSLTEATRHAAVNVTGTAMMLDALARAQVIPRRFVLASSRAVYGEGAWRSLRDGSTHYPGQRTRAQLAAGEWDFPGFEALPSEAATTRPAPVSVYGATKLAQEHILGAWAMSYGSELAVLRLQNVFGPGQSLVNPYTGIVPLFCRLAREGRSIPLYEDGAMLRDFVLIDDVAAALLQAIDITQVPGQPVDIGTMQRVSIANLAARIAALYSAPAPHVCGLYRYGDVRHGACRSDATEALLGWRPQHGLDDGLAALARWIDSRLAQATT